MRRDRRPEIPGCKTRYPEVPSLNKSKSRHLEIEKMEFPDHKRVNPEVPKGPIPSSDMLY